MPRKPVVRKKPTESIPMWTYRERRNRAAFSSAQHAWDFAGDPLWDQPDPEPEHDDEEQEADDGLGE